MNASSIVLRKCLLVVCTVALFIGASAEGQKRRTPRRQVAAPGQSSPTPTATPTPTPSPSPIKTQSLIEITLTPSRRQTTAGSGFGIVADITNKSNQSVYLHPQYLTMTPPPEINQDQITYWYAVIPPEIGNNTYDKVVHLGPGSTTTAFWTGYGPGPEGQQNARPWWKPRWLSYFDFPPGEYTIKVVGSYWTNLEDAQKKNGNYISESAETKVLVASPQWVILFGAFVGGLIAYFLLPNVRLHPQSIDFTGLLTAALLSTIVTILLSRLSETQFLIRVTVNDFWGAIVVGFVGSASGTSVLQKFGFSDRVRPNGNRATDWLRRRRQRLQERKEKRSPVSSPPDEENV